MCSCEDVATADCFSVFVVFKHKKYKQQQNLINCGLVHQLRTKGPEACKALLGYLFETSGAQGMHLK
jgi:hypothetical protein